MVLYHDEGAMHFVDYLLNRIMIYLSISLYKINEQPFDPTSFGNNLYSRIAV